ncbi:MULTISPECIES: acyl carrier protein [unclassified Cellvibrio]|jgi:acyl carrier protein|uniref:acyl carrier protein n=1 Tax=unclassified Cellvibrio TaxID=2624793 RepID=UPI00124818BC|nr:MULTISPECIES: acyl carrier protein [unclassified Cellvibrio]QEY11856.1 acyl carrier protein [Cellvibrio sp. KY-YJ-3]UUA72046.1 acyl carrier protein [Cellvibrio sp. QJXJ]
MIHTRDSLLTRIADILQEQFDVEPGSITLDSRLREDLDIDSIDAVNLMIELKSITAKKITLENFHQVKTIGDLIDAILAFLSQENAQGQAAH